MEETYVLAMRCPVYRRRDSNLGFRAELENLAAADNGKGTSGRTARPKVRCARPGADCSVVALKRGNTRGAKGQVTCVEIELGQLETGGTRAVSTEGGSLHWVA